MSIVSLSLSFILFRMLEEAVYYLQSFFFSSKRERGSTEGSVKRLTATVTPELHKRLKDHVESLGMTITQYVFLAVMERYEKETKKEKIPSC